MANIPKFQKIPYFICEIFLEQEESIRARLENYHQITSIDQKETTERIIKFLTDIYGSSLPQDDVKSTLLCQYWHLAQQHYPAWSQIVECFLNLIAYGNSSTRNESSMDSSFKLSTESLNCKETGMKMLVNTELHDNINDTSRKIDKHISLLQDLYDGLEKMSRVEEFMIEKHPNMDTQNADLQFRLKQKNMPNEELTQEFLNLTPEICSELKLVTDQVIEDIKKWKTSQKLEYVKAGKCQSLPILKRDCSTICRMLMKMIEILNGDGFKGVIYGIMPHEPQKFENRTQCLVESLTNLFQNCFVVTVQPTDVQKVTGPSGPVRNQASKDKEPSGRGKKTSDRSEKSEEGSSRNSGLKMGPEFEVELQILCGEGLDCISNVTKPVTAKFFYEANQIGGEPCAQLHVPKAVVDKHGVASFKRQKIKKFERPTKGSKNEQVTSERYRIVFETEITLSNPQINLRLETMSLPLAIITGSNQANITHGALLWYCYNTDPYLLESSPSTLPKQTVINMIQDCFSYLGGRKLRQDELDYLFDLVLDCKTDVITFEEFVTKNYASIKDHTFWKWMQSILNLIQYYLLQPWKDEIVYGFVSKDRSIELLKKEPSGTFLMRFSESIISGDGQNKNLTGAIVIALSLNSGEGNPEKARVTFTKPLTVSKYFAKNSIKDIICGVMDSNHKGLLKRVYGTRISIKNIKERYAQIERPDDHNYPHWCERVFIELMADFRHLVVDDADGEVESQATKRKVARRTSGSQVKTIPDHMLQNTQNTLPNPDIANQLLKHHTTSNPVDNTGTGQIPSTVTEVLLTEHMQRFLSSEGSPMLGAEQVISCQTETDYAQNFDEGIPFQLYGGTIQNENSFSQTYAGLTANSTFSPESTISMETSYDNSPSEFFILERQVSSPSLSPEASMSYNQNFN